MTFKQDAKGRIISGGANSTSFKPGEKATETLKPEETAEIITLMAEDPSASMRRLAEAVGMPKSTVESLVRRLETKYQPVLEEVKRFTSASLVMLIEEKLPMLLRGITEEKVDAARLNEIGVIFGILTEKRQLLNGEPTHIFTHQERQNMNELLPEIMREAKKRGLIVDVTYQEIPEVMVIPPDVPHEAGLSKTVAAQNARDNRAKARR